MSTDRITNVRVSATCAFAFLLAASGCASLKSIAGGIGDAGSFIGDALSGPKAEFSRPAPAAKDLPSVKSVVLGEFQGEGAEQLKSLVKARLAESGRFKIVPPDRVEELARSGGCDTSDVACIARVQPGIALVTGSVTTSEYDEDVEESVIDCPTGKKKQNTKCASQVRTGKARVALELKLKGPDGTLLAERTSSKTAEKEESNLHGKAKAIDGNRLIADARGQAAEEFFHLVSPRRVKESVPLESDSDIPELEQGVDRLADGSTSEGVQLLRKAVERADAQSDVELKAKAHYSLGVGLLAEARFTEALAELKKAHGLTPEDDWAELIKKAQSWDADASRYERQVALGKETPTAMPQAVAASAETNQPADAAAPAAPATPTAEPMP